MVTGGSQRTRRSDSRSCIRSQRWSFDATAVGHAARWNYGRKEQGLSLKSAPFASMRLSFLLGRTGGAAGTPAAFGISDASAGLLVVTAARRASCDARCKRCTHAHSVCVRACVLALRTLAVARQASALLQLTRTDRFKHIRSVTGPHHHRCS